MEPWQERVREKYNALEIKRTLAELGYGLRRQLEPYLQDGNFTGTALKHLDELIGEFIKNAYDVGRRDATPPAAERAKPAASDDALAREIWLCCHTGSSDPIKIIKQCLADARAAVILALRMEKF